MYTSTKINPQTKTINSSKRIFLNHKEQRHILEGSKEALDKYETVESKIYYTNVPLDGKSTKDIIKAHEITLNVVKNIILNQALGDVEVITKVREKDQVIVSDILFKIKNIEDDDIKAEEKNIWYPLKMETLKELISHKEIGEYIPLNDHQIKQLTEYLNIA